MQRRWRRTTILSSLAAAATLFCASAPVANAAPPSSAVDVSATTVQPGQEFTVTQTVTNTISDGSTVTSTKAAIYGDSTRAITDVADLVSCTGTTAACGQLGSSYRAPLGDLAGGETRTVVFTLRVKDTAAPGQFTLRHQLLGENYAFDILDGPVITIPAPPNADVAVSLAATPRSGLAARVDYTLTVTNSGPATATGIRVVATNTRALRMSGATGCTGGPNTLNCDVASLAPGGTATAKFTAEVGLLAIGSFTTSVQRQQSSPDDSNPANDSASKTCSALTGLIVNC